MIARPVPGSEFEEEFAFEIRDNEDDRGLKPGRIPAEAGAKWFRRRGAGEMDLFCGGGGELDGVLCAGRRSSHIMAVSTGPFFF